MWVFFALGASVLWGLTYVINEQIYKKISIITSLGITSLFAAVALLLIAFQSGILKSDLAVIVGSKQLLRLITVEAIVLIIAELFIGLSITSKNAALSGLIEISYPIFIVIFAYLFFKEAQINTYTFFAGGLIFLGVIIIYYINK